MTLVLAAATPRYVVQAADRLLTKAATVHDPISNKTIICSLNNAVIVMSYSGIAYLGRQPTDEWLAEILWGNPIARGRDGMNPVAFSMMQRPNNWTLDRTVSVLKRKIENIPQRSINIGGFYLSIAGWRFGRESPRSFLIEIERQRNAHIATIAGTPRRARPGNEFVIGRIGANITPSQISAEFDRYRKSQTLNMEDVEKTFVEIIRSVAHREKTVGKNILCTMFPIDGPAISRFHPATMHAVRIEHPKGETIIPVAHSPWILSSNCAQAPQIKVGEWLTDLDGRPLLFDAPTPSHGILAIAKAISRPGP